MWLKEEVKSSKYLAITDKLKMIEKMQRRTKIFIEDHHLVEWFLDPRTRGCGLSAPAKRKVRDLGIKLFRALYPEIADAKVNRFVQQWIAYASYTGL